MFDKEAYWKNRNNEVEVTNPETGEKYMERHPLRGQGNMVRATVKADTTAERGFDNNGSIVIKNRAYRRQRIFKGFEGFPSKRPQTKKGFKFHSPSA